MFLVKYMKDCNEFRLKYYCCPHDNFSISFNKIMNFFSCLPTTLTLFRFNSFLYTSLEEEWWLFMGEVSYVCLKIFFYVCKWSQPPTQKESDLKKSLKIVYFYLIPLLLLRRKVLFFDQKKLKFLNFSLKEVLSTKFWMLKMFEI